MGTPGPPVYAELPSAVGKPGPPAPPPEPPTCDAVTFTEQPIPPIFPSETQSG